MKTLRKLFGELDMTWPRVLLFAVITGVATGLVMCIDALADTSFQDIGIVFDCWFIFAIIIVVNCKTMWEAALKCFVFFLVSQPLVYLVEVPFKALGWGLFMYYKYWFIVTLLTLPGGAIAFLVKKKNWLSVAVLSVATGYLAYMTAYYLRSVIMNFPHHLLSALFCMTAALLLPRILLDDKKQRTAAKILVTVVFALSCIYNVVSTSRRETLQLGEGEWTCSIDDESVASVELNGDGSAEVKAEKLGGTCVTFTDSDGKEQSYYITVSGGGLWVSPID